MAILADSTLDVWRGSFGDSGALSWVITAAYLAAAALCGRCALAARRYATDDPQSERPGPWSALAGGLLLLGLNKQLDLQILVREIGIAFVGFLGLDQHRRWVGRLFVLVLGLFLLRVLALAARRVWGHTRGHRLLLIGLALLATFAVVRAGTYVPGLKQFNLRYKDALHLVFELGGIILLGLGAWRTRQRLDRHHSSSISSA